MADAPTYATYVAAGGQLSEAAFLASLVSAQAAVDEAVWPNTVVEATQTAYELAICAVVDLIDTPAVSSESIGRASFTYADVPTIAKAIRRHLTGTGLLNRAL